MQCPFLCTCQLKQHHKLFLIEAKQIFLSNVENIASNGYLFMYDCSKNGRPHSELGIRDVSYKYPQVMHHLYGLHIF